MCFAFSLLNTLVVFFQKPWMLEESLESQYVKLQAGDSDSDIDGLENLWVEDSPFITPSLKHQTKA